VFVKLSKPPTRLDVAALRTSTREHSNLHLISRSGQPKAGRWNDVVRKALSKKIRFEVFKRDGFKCQYCGAAAPDVLLQVDHLSAVKLGGTNDLLNLVTACAGCNGGKGATALSDSSALAKQHAQLQELNARREQMRMMVEWKSELSRIEEDEIMELARAWNSLAPGLVVNENGLRTLRLLRNKYAFSEIWDAIQVATSQYLTVKDGKATPESFELAFKKVSGVCYVTRAQKNKPYLRDLFYIRGILRNSVYVNESRVVSLIEEAIHAGLCVECIKVRAKSARSWTQFRTALEEFTWEEHPKGTYHFTSEGCGSPN
jgi:5-methylcytosine-specific restriction endonuclease McrA